MRRNNVALECFCGRTYAKVDDLEEHRRARGHFKSHVCGPSCNHPPAPPQILRSRSCPTCSKICANEDVFKDHVTVTGHCYCADCNRSFPSDAELRKHMKTEIHASQFRCCDCSIDFKDIHALEAHVAGRKHKNRTNMKSMAGKTIRKAAGREELSCSKCKQQFKDSAALEQHRKSLRHAPLSNLSCPLGKSCKKHFSSPSALLHHLESGGCDSGMTRHRIHHLVRAYDSDHILSVDLGSSMSDLSMSWRSEVVYTPDTDDLDGRCSMMDRPLASVSDAGSQWEIASETGIESPLPTLTGENGQRKAGRLMCPSCPHKRKGFQTFEALANHMASPAHSPKVYRCPLRLITPKKSSAQDGTHRLFSTVSGLTQHLESGACKGGKKGFLKIMKFVQGRLDQLGIRDVSLLL